MALTTQNNSNGSWGIVNALGVKQSLVVGVSLAWILGDVSSLDPMVVHCAQFMINSRTSTCVVHVSLRRWASQCMSLSYYLPWDQDLGSSWQ